jgi:hypothetical protein
MSGLHAR